MRKGCESIAEVRTAEVLRQDSLRRFFRATYFKPAWGPTVLIRPVLEFNDLPSRLKGHT